MNAYDFNTSFMKADPFAGMNPCDREPLEDEPIMCHCCEEVDVKSEGDLCAECYADYVLHLND